MEKVKVNSLGMRLRLIHPGIFEMGVKPLDWDEKPIHSVTITSPFYLAETPVTNAQYEAFQKEHARYRNLMCESHSDNAAVICVTWEEANAFCEWLSEKEGEPYRLPTEAEWEYACRAGSTKKYWMGNNLPKKYRRNNPRMGRIRREKNLAKNKDTLVVGQQTVNPWGLHDMHGLVEEWCYDWYGPYRPEAQSDPVGYASGDFKVTRGGSYDTLVKYLRSGNRLALPPKDKSDLVGFRVVQGALPTTRLLNQPLSQSFLKTSSLKSISQEKADWIPQRDMGKPFFAEPIPYVIPPESDKKDNKGSNFTPFYHHNHCPAITYCDNGDLLACWFSTTSESGREMVILSSRLRYGADKWEPAQLFFKAADRNMTGSSLFNLDGRLLHFNGIEEAQSWVNLVMVMRESTDNGQTWTQARLISAEFEGFMHRRRNQVIACTRKLSNGYLLQLCDASPASIGGTALHRSVDGGLTWVDLGLGKPLPNFSNGNMGNYIAGIHASVVELTDGRLLAFGRGNDIEGKMPKSISNDGGYTWTYSPSPFPPIDGGQRLVLIRLMEGPLLFISFTGYRPRGRQKEGPGMDIPTLGGKMRHVHGMFSALSFDDGKTWSHYRLLSEGNPRKFRSADFIRSFVMDPEHAEPAGYLVAVQTPDHIIHLISSYLYYQFNLEWLKSPMP